MFRWLSKAVGRIKSAVFSQWVMRLAGGDIVQLKDYSSYMAAGCKKVWATWRAIDLIAQKAACIPVKVTVTGSTKPVTDKALLELLKFPNPYQTFYELIYLVIFHMRLTGNAYLYKSNVNFNGQKPDGLWPLNPKRVKILPNQNGVGVRGYLYKSNGIDIPFEADEIIHIKRPHPDNDFYGLGDIEAAEPLLNGWLNKAAYKEAFYKNGASPSGVMVCEGASDPDQIDIAKKQWNKEYGGAENTGKTAWLAGNWKYQKLGLTASEMQDIEESKLSIENIFTLHGVPLSVAGIRDAANFATAEIDNQRFLEFAVLPCLILISAKLNAELVDGFNPQYELAFEISGLQNIGQIIIAYSGLFDRGGMTINELREKCNLPRNDDIPMWNEPFISAGLVPLSLSGIADMGATEKAAERTVDRFLAGAERRNETN